MRRAARSTAFDAQLRRRPARSGGAVRGRGARRCCWSPSTCRRSGALATRDASRGPAGRGAGARATRGARRRVASSGSARRGRRSCQATPARSALRGARAAGQRACADALPLVRSAARGDAGTTCTLHAVAERQLRCSSGADAGMKRRATTSSSSAAGSRGLTLALQLRAALRRARDPGARAPRASGAGSGAQGRRVVGRDRRQLLQPRCSA